MPAPTHTSVDAVLIGYERQENLGLRSILAYLRSRGYRAELVPFEPGDHSRVLAEVRRLRPRLVGFSLIFQYALDDFAALLRALRAAEIDAHFTAGGHFPSLRPDQALRLLPELDSVVRFEGEQTTLELLEALDAPQRWPCIPGLAFRRGEALTVTPPRPLVTDLDTLPPIARDRPQEAAPGVRMAAMLASRGCLFDCAFCSIRNFYGGTPGALRRTRSPDAVVTEMSGLHAEHGVRYFSFQDDDFAARTTAQRRWLFAFLGALRRAGLASQVRWKVSCRVTDLEADTLRAMQDHGLFAVYLGVESGSAAGLRALNKRTTVEQNLAAVELVKDHGVALSMGFMLLDPSSTVDTLRENIAFLASAGSDGYFPVNFCKMLPYAGTPVEAQLRAAGRLSGSVTQPDYDYPDPLVGWYQVLVQQAFSRRNFDPAGNVAILQRLDFEHRLAMAFGLEGLAPALGDALRAIIARSNTSAVRTLSGLLELLLEVGPDRLPQAADRVVELAGEEWRTEMEIDLELFRLAGARAWDAAEEAPSRSGAPSRGPATPAQTVT